MTRTFMLLYCMWRLCHPVIYRSLSWLSFNDYQKYHGIPSSPVSSAHDYTIIGAELLEKSLPPFSMSCNNSLCSFKVHINHGTITLLSTCRYITNLTPLTFIIVIALFAAYFAAGNSCFCVRAGNTEQRDILVACCVLS